MSWNGSGVFNRIYSWIADAAAGIDITASRMDTDTNDIVSNGFGNTLTRDGQGSATANQPMNSFRHTGVGNGVNPTDYIALGQLQPGGNAGALGITSLAAVGDVKVTALPESILPTGWRVCAGQTRPRTDPLWLATGAISAGNWVWGAGDGSTTYNLPDFRGRSVFGKDDMNGTAANRVTSGISGVDGVTLGATGGNQSLQAHGHTDSGHDHTDAGHSHTDSGHVHTDAGHSHTAPGANFVISGAGGNPGSGSTSSQSQAAATAASTANIQAGNANIQTGIADIQSATANITSTGSGASQNMPPAVVVNMIIYCGA